MTITWNESVPSPSSAASTADDELRNFMVAVASGLSPSFLWPGSGGQSAASAGLSRLGNARMAIAGNSAVTGGYGDGYLLLNRNHISVHHIGSTWTAMLGHSAMVNHNPPQFFTAAVQTAAYWVTQSGSTSIASGSSFGSLDVTFSTPYSQTAPPFILVSAQPNNLFSLNSSYGLQISSISTVGFSAVYSGFNAAPGATVIWESNGTVLL